MAKIPLALALLAVACGGSGAAVPCGAGTHLENGSCVLTVRCGTGTHQAGVDCLPDDAGVRVVCGPGTTLDGGVCTAAAPCGAGAHVDGGICVSDSVCGAGAHVDGGTCVSDSVCGAGAHVDGGTCVSDSVCGAGAHVDGGTCVADSVCGAGAHVDGGTCVSDSVCGAGAHLENGVCVPDVVCGTGTHAVAGQCLADAVGPSRFEIRLPAQDIIADGFSKVPVVAMGTMADGSPSTEPVVLGTSLTGAGTLSPQSFSLPTVGRDLFFTPCSSSSPGCSGVFQITLALASAPNTVVAKSWPLPLQAPAGVGSTAPCLGGGNVVFFDGDVGDFIHSGTDTVTDGIWRASASSTDVAIHVDPTHQAQGLWWDMNFSTSQLGQAIATQVYLNAERWPFAAPGHPGLDVSGDGRGCNVLTGKFQVEDLQLSGSTLTSFTATFEQHCEAGTPALRGCVHYGP